MEGKRIMGLNSGKRDKDHFRGCLLGGAVGDALGWPVEFLKLNHTPAEAGVCRLSINRHFHAGENACFL